MTVGTERLKNLRTRECATPSICWALPFARATNQRIAAPEKCFINYLGIDKNELPDLGLPTKRKFERDDKYVDHQR